jgi:exonuclease III
VRGNDISVMVETRADQEGIKQFMAHQPNHTYHACFAPKSGRGGQGVAVIVSERMQPYVSRCASHQLTDHSSVCG